ncbi:MoaD/ThiS family protein [Alteromonas gracilis]
MTAATGSVPRTVTVRYWASARAAAGTSEEVVPWEGPAPLGELLSRIGSGRGPDFARVVGACSVLVGDTRGTEATPVEPGATVELLPPFAGG